MVQKKHSAGIGLKGSYCVYHCGFSASMRYKKEATGEYSIFEQ